MVLHIWFTFFSNGSLLPFVELQEKFGLPQCTSLIYSYDMQSRHKQEIICGHNPLPLSSINDEVSHFKGFISRSYAMLLSIFLAGFPTKVTSPWERDVGTLEEDQWAEALQAIQGCSLNAAQRLSQLYIVLRVHLTPARLHRMGISESADCTRCARDHGDLIHLLWRCPKLHLYWRGVLTTINKVFLVNVPQDL